MSTANRIIPDHGAGLQVPVPWISSYFASCRERSAWERDAFLTAERHQVHNAWGEWLVSGYRWRRDFHLVLTYREHLRKPGQEPEDLPLPSVEFGAAQVRRFLANLANDTRRVVRCLVAPEARHVSGSLHWHLLLGFRCGAPWLPVEVVHACWGKAAGCRAGAIRLTALDGGNRQAVSEYVIKDVAKGLSASGWFLVNQRPAQGEDLQVLPFRRNLRSVRA